MLCAKPVLSVHIGTLPSGRLCAKIQTPSGAVLFEGRGYHSQSDLEQAVRLTGCLSDDDRRGMLFVTPTAQ